MYLSFYSALTIRSRRRCCGSNGRSLGLGNARETTAIRVIGRMECDRDKIGC